MATFKDINENSMPAKIIVVTLGFILIVGLFVYKAYQQPELGIDYTARRENKKKEEERRKKEIHEFLFELREDNLGYLQLRLKEFKNDNIWKEKND